MTIGASALCDSGQKRPEKLAKAYIDLHLAAYGASNANQHELSRVLHRKLAGLAREIQADDAVFDAFRKQYERLDKNQSYSFLSDLYWPFRTKKSYEYLTRRLQKAGQGEVSGIGKLLGKRDYRAARLRIKAIYDKQRKSISRGGEAIWLAICLIWFGDDGPLLDLVDVIEKQGRAANRIAGHLSSGVDFNKATTRLCAGPLIEEYLRQKARGSDPLLLGNGLADCFDLDVDWRRLDSQTHAITVLDAWLTTEASKTAKFKSYRRLGYLAGKYRRAERAIAYLDKALALRPKDFDARFVKAFCLMGVDREDETITILAALIKENQSSFKCWYMMGRAKMLKKDFAGAKKACQRALAIDPDHVGAMKLLQETYVKLGQKEQAKAIEQRLNKLTTRPATTRPKE